MTKKLKLSKEQIQEIISDPEKAASIGISVKDPWWLIVLKVLKYVLELVIAGAAGFIAVGCARGIGIY